MSMFSFPQEYLIPLPTALGPAWPNPRTRMILADLDNIQKRLTDLRMRLDGVRYLPLKKEQRQQKFDELMAQGKKMEEELQDLMYKLKESPSRKPHFKDPRRQISRCCDSYVRELMGDNTYTYECIECGSKGCRVYNRIEEEKWNEEYALILKEKEGERLKDLEAIKATPSTSNPSASKGIDGGFLLT